MIQHHNTLDNIINSKQEILVTVDGEAKIENVDYEDVEGQIVFKHYIYFLKYYIKFFLKKNIINYFFNIITSVLK